MIDRSIPTVTNTTITTITRTLCLSLLLLSSSSSSAAESPPMFCQGSGWCNGGPSRTGPSINTVTADRIDDGYCDCPWDGRDEPNTNACAGSIFWAGIVTHENKDDEPSRRPPSSTFVCPGDPSTTIPLSRHDDGVCDCCDGKDEPTSGADCDPNGCRAVEEERRRRSEEKRKTFESGFARRKLALEEFAGFQERVRASVVELETIEIPRTKEKIAATEDAKRKLEDEWKEERTRLLFEITNDDSDHLPPNVLTDEERFELVVGFCQLRGERDGIDECDVLDEALSYAGRSPEEEEEEIEPNDEEEGEAAVFSRKLVVENAEKALAEIRALLNVDHDHPPNNKNDDDDDDEEDYEEDDYADEWDDPHHEKELREAFGNNDDDEDDDGEDDDDDVNDEDEIEDDNDDEETVTEDEEDNVPEEHAPEDDDNNNNKDTPIDKGLLRRTKSDLVDLVESLNHGEKAARHARNRLSNLPSCCSNELVTAVLYLSDTSSDDAVDIVTGIVPELPTPDDDDDDNNDVCVGTTEEACASVPKKFVLPTNVSDGWSGYVSSKPRGTDDENDPLVGVFRPLEDSKTRHDPRELENELETLRDELKRSEKDLDKNIDDDDSRKEGDDKKYGPSGILHALANECFSGEAGKYTYEACVLARASQKDGNGSTNLGRYEGFYVSSKGAVILKFDNGTKCYNGPKRSVTVMLVCGDVHGKVVRAEEPETCRYEMVMETFVVCDEAYAERHGLLIKDEQQE